MVYKMSATSSPNTSKSKLVTIISEGDKYISIPILQLRDWDYIKNIGQVYVSILGKKTEGVRSRIKTMHFMCKYDGTLPNIDLLLSDFHVELNYENENNISEYNFYFHPYKVCRGLANNTYHFFNPDIYVEDLLLHYRRMINVRMQIHLEYNKKHGDPKVIRYEI